MEDYQRELVLQREAALHQEYIEDPKFWMHAYWDVWHCPSVKISHCLRGKKGVDILDRTPLITFPEYISDKDYCGHECNFDIIPNRFIHQTNRLVVAYNNLILWDDIHVQKTAKVVNLAHRAIYEKDCDFGVPIYMRKDN